MNPSDRVREFHLAFDQAAPDGPPLRPDAELVRFRMRLIREEYAELRDELKELLNPHLDTDEIVEVLRRLLKEACDLQWVIQGTTVSLGLPLDEAYVEVHRSNMSKLGADGQPIKRADGKILKGPDYSPADMVPFVPGISDITFEED